jgi:hypothetical protein
MSKATKGYERSAAELHASSNFLTEFAQTNPIPPPRSGGALLANMVHCEILLSSYLKLSQN